ncbi:hypothetical protein A3A18_01900 [Candidatus Azambacteria bacterium RIFCSPLOWO2_01_FULL_44_84]|uniref:Uncharacterized protein n=1 Tax=Candidatus Azambacteria bacterium RIFCSPLOWO2_02_FULL_44_14 TaxID=1797306 RepID=A0A1F5C9U7_9BACT|nr:MAG: hypothetical protein A3A18_01900 [Candidatus Azambacteria bacterium RIFCSPLOWO2_01_FULL_44_84]OGD39611.1 MAG: hypothetical protein A3I30_03870 [Candidatus Azambacteria bacterium RIFCSPLOWO2_02_FULL_44_14]OGD49267.1 MAG: hypothetical protein A2608_01550 [Candidatus Azambacteria bacterium RIFOXYD1_FULL_44_10]
MIAENLNLKVFSQEILSFVIVGVISIFVAARFQALSAEVAPQVTAVSWWQFLLAFGIGTAVILGLIRIMHGGWFLRLFFIFALFSGMLITFNLFLSDIAAVIFSAFLVAAYVIWPYVWLHDAVMILTLPGIAVLIGLSLQPWFAVLILIIMSVYDYIAVYKTKHMIKMAKAMIAGRAIFAMIFPEEFRNFKSKINEAHPGQGFMMLGTGDFVFPLIMAASAMTVSYKSAWIVLGFSIFGLLLMHLLFISQRVRRPMPALPPLAGFAILGFITSLLLK